MARGKITPVGRLIIFILVFAPIAYFGASFITGQSYKDFVGDETTNSTPINREPVKKENVDLQHILQEKDNIILEYEKQNKVQREEIKALKAEIERLNN